MPKDLTKNRYYDSFSKSLETNKPVLKDKARLYYYSQKMNEKLREKNPEVYDEMSSKYGWNPDAPLASNTRITGADEYAKNNPDFYLSSDEQKQLLGENWDDYYALRGKYGKDYSLTGAEDAENPEAWKYGARHAVAFNPTRYVYETASKEDPLRPISKFKYSVSYDPTTDSKYVETIDDESEDGGDKYIGYLKGKDKNIM